MLFAVASHTIPAKGGQRHCSVHLWHADSEDEAEGLTMAAHIRAKRTIQSMVATIVPERHLRRALAEMERHNG